MEVIWRCRFPKPTRRDFRPSSRPTNVRGWWVVRSNGLGVRMTGVPPNGHRRRPAPARYGGRQSEREAILKSQVGTTDTVRLAVHWLTQTKLSLMCGDTQKRTQVREMKCSRGSHAVSHPPSQCSTASAWLHLVSFAMSLEHSASAQLP